MKHKRADARRLTRFDEGFGSGLVCIWAQLGPLHAMDQGRMASSRGGGVALESLSSFRSGATD